MNGTLLEWTFLSRLESCIIQAWNDALPLPAPVDLSAIACSSMFALHRQWKCRFRPLLYMVLGILASIMGLIIAVGETFILPYHQAGKPRASFVSWLLIAARKHDAPISVMQTTTAIPLAYICICAYFSLFKLGMFSFYAVCIANEIVSS